MDVFHIPVEHAFDRFGVVQDTVVGRLGQRQNPRFDLVDIHTLQMLPNQRIGHDLGLDGSGFELALRDGADDAKVIARGLQKDRDRPGHDDRMQNRLVAIAVHYHHVIGGNSVVPHHLVARAGAIGNKKAVIGIENSRSVALALANGTVMVKQLPQLFHRIADIGPQHVFTIKLVVHLTDRTFQKRDSA